VGLQSSYVYLITDYLTLARMRNAHILLITIRSLANEIAKNLVLAGIGSLTVLDSEVVHEDDLGAQFFIGEEHIGMNVCL
jgi:ubiquitin-like 1-activating enzyme E1 A